MSENGKQKNDEGAEGQVNELVSLDDAFIAACTAAEYLGDVLNNLDMVDEEVIEHTAPLFDRIYRYLEQSS